jgi:hypothetical protein
MQTNKLEEKIDKIECANEEKINKIECANEEKINKIECANEEIRHQNDLLKSRIERMEEHELKRIKKEKRHERRILIRDLFLTARRRLSQELKKRKLPKNTLNIIYGSTMIQLSKIATSIKK